MYEGDPVPHDHNGEWAGFDACEKCFLEYEIAQASPVLLASWWRNARVNRKS